jgi:hypothetical protein
LTREERRSEEKRRVVLRRDEKKSVERTREKWGKNREEKLL